MRRILATVLITAAVVVPATRAMSAGSQPPPPPVEYTVKAGETLWGIARAAEPGEDPRKIVDRLIEINDLSSASILPGQVLILPSR